MDNILEKYVGNLPSFISFLEKEWGWEITYSEDGQQLLVDENKDFCVCPIANNIQGKASGKLCNCSEKFFAQFSTEPLPAKAGRFGMLLKQPKACTLKVIFFPLLLNLSQSYQSYSSPVDLDSEYTL